MWDDARRFAVVTTLAVGAHACLLAAASHGRISRGVTSEATASPDPRATEDAAARGARIARERAAILASAERDITAGRATLGEILIRLGALDREEESADAGEASAARADLDRALASYRVMLEETRARVVGGEDLGHAISLAASHDGRAGRYKRMYRRLADALANGGGNCVAESTLAVALASDAGGDAARASAGFVVYANHVAPELGGFHFGMTSKCHGAGVRVPAKGLLAAYRVARDKRDTEPFALPRSTDACDDPGDVFGALQLAAVDPPEAPKAKPPEDGECRRRTVIDEYEDDVEVFTADGRSLGGVLTPRAPSLNLAGHAASVSCVERRLAGLDESDPETLVLALGDAAIAAEEAARVFAAAGETDVAKEYDQRLAALRERAAAPLERVISGIESASVDGGATPPAVLVNAGRLVALGEGGRTAMLLASDRHSGYWEIASLLTRPSSQVGATERWAQKPLAVKIAVVDILPCASEVFLSQLDAVRTPASASLRAACEARVRGEREACVLDDALARTAPDNLSQAVLVHRMLARCRDETFGRGARVWSGTKPGEVSSALAKRLGP